MEYWTEREKQAGCMGICHNVHRRRHRWGFCRHDRQAMRKQKYNILKSLATKYTVENQLLPRGVPKAHWTLWIQPLTRIERKNQQLGKDQRLSFKARFHCVCTACLHTTIKWKGVAKLSSIRSCLSVTSCLGLMKNWPFPFVPFLLPHSWKPKQVLRTFSDRVNEGHTPTSLFTVQAIAGFWVLIQG